MIAIDLAELVGSAIALQLLFGLPLAIAFLVNAAILVLAGGAFHGRGLPSMLPCWRQGRVPQSRAPWPVRW